MPLSGATEKEAVLEGAQAEEVAAAAFQLHVLAHDLFNWIAGDQLVDKCGGKRHAGTSFRVLSAHLPCVGDEDLLEFVDGIFVGHAGNVVAHHPLHAVEIKLGREILGKLLGVRDIVFI